MTLQESKAEFQPSGCVVYLYYGFQEGRQDDNPSQILLLRKVEEGRLRLAGLDADALLFQQSVDPSPWFHSCHVSHAPSEKKRQRTSWMILCITIVHIGPLSLR